VTDVGILKAAMTPVAAGDLAQGGVSGSGGTLVVPNRAESAFATLRFRLKNVPLEAAEEPFEAAGHKFPAGSLIVTSDEARPRLDREARALGLEAVAV